MVVGSCIGTAYDHDCYVFVVDAVVVDGWFEEVGVLFEPEGLREVYKLGEAAYHFGMFNGVVSILDVYELCC